MPKATKRRKKKPVDLVSINKSILRRVSKPYEITLASETDLLQTSWLSTGVLAFDKCVGSGLPWGRIIEIFGDWSTGKSVTLLKAISMAQQAGAITALFDSEGSLEAEFAMSHHVDLDLLLYNQPESLERTFRAMAFIIRHVEDLYPGRQILFGLDSLAAFPAEEELDNTKRPTRQKSAQVIDNRTAGMRRATIIGNAMRKLNTKISRGKHLFIFTNQTRDQINKYGDPDVTCGGRAVKFHCAVRIRNRKLKTIRKNKRIVGYLMEMFVKKNKVNMPFRKCKFFLSKSGRIAKYSGYRDFLHEEGVIEKVRKKRGEKEQTWKYGDETFKQSEFRAFIRKHKELQ
jgi:recombination protein RecA